MSRSLRLEFPGSLWHITARGNERASIFRDEGDRLLLLELLAQCVERFEWILPAYALMPNHFHLIVELVAKTLSRGMQWLEGEYVRRFNRRHRRGGHLFQGRFHGVVVDKETYYLEVLRYVVLNPVRAGLVKRPEQDPWTSYGATVGDVAEPKWLAVDDALAPFGPTRETARPRYREFVHAGIGERTKPWDNVVGQIYLGGQEWLEKIKQQIALRPRSDEFPETQRLCGSAKMSTVVAAVAETLAIDEDRLRQGHGGLPRMIAAWIGSRNAHLSNREIAAGLRLESASHVSALARQCERQMSTNEAVRLHIDDCLRLVEKTANRSSDPNHSTESTRSPKRWTAQRTSS